MADKAENNSGNAEEENYYTPPTDVITVTTPYVPGYKVTRTIGATFGLIVRSRGLGQNIWAFFRSWGGGEIKVYTNLLAQVRQQAIERMCEHAKGLGANAVLSIGFDTSEIGSVMTEVLAFGTAVVVEPEAETAQPVSLR